MRRYASIAAFTLVAVGLTACGGGGAGSDSGASSPAPAPAPAPAAPPAAPSAAPSGDTPGGEMPDGVTAEMIAQGETLFASTGLCFSCHGPTGAGVPQLGPDLTDDVWLNTDGTFDGIVAVITDGVAEPKEAVAPMMARGGSSISDDEVRAIAAYVISLGN